MKNDRPFKILYLMEFPIDLAGGGQMSTQTLCEGLNGEEFETVAVCPRLLKKHASDYPFGIVTYRSDENREKSSFLRILNFVKRIGSFYRIIRRQKPDIIHVSMSESLITFGFLRCLGIFHRIPFVYTDRGLAYGYRKHSRKCILATLRHADRLITTTHFNEDLWLKTGVKTDVTVIHNTIGRVFAHYDPTAHARIREKYGIGGSDFVIGFAGRISEEKDWDFAPVLTGALHDAGIPFKVALVISVYEEQDEAITARIRGAIADQIGEENLLYLQDLTQDEMADYYYLPDVFVMTSMFESFGKAAVEAMSRKCAVLSTSVGGLTEVIEKSEDLYTKDDVARFVNRVKQLRESPDLLQEEREYFYRRYLDNFTLETHLNRHRELYREILTKHRMI